MWRKQALCSVEAWTKPTIVRILSHSIPNVFPSLLLRAKLRQDCHRVSPSLKSVCSVGGEGRQVWRKSPVAAFCERLCNWYSTVCDFFSVSCWKSPSGCKSFHRSCPSDKCLGIGKGRGDVLLPSGSTQGYFRGPVIYAETQGCWSLYSQINRSQDGFALMVGSTGRRCWETRSPGRAGLSALWRCSHFSKESTSKLSQPWENYLNSLIFILPTCKMKTKIAATVGVVECYLKHL